MANGRRNGLKPPTTRTSQAQLLLFNPLPVQLPPAGPRALETCQNPLGLKRRRQSRGK